MTRAHPYMLDGPVPWLSVDTRVFQIAQGQMKFGVTMGGDPNAFITQVVHALRTGSGTAGGDTFDGCRRTKRVPRSSTRHRLGASTCTTSRWPKFTSRAPRGATGVQALFRLFRWGVANVEFDDTLAYRTNAPPTGAALLGRTTTNELATIPFFGDARVAVTAPMTGQPDTTEHSRFPGGRRDQLLRGLAGHQPERGTLSNHLSGDGGFGGVPAAQMRSIRDLLIGQHSA